MHTRSYNRLSFCLLFAFFRCKGHVTLKGAVRRYLDCCLLLFRSVFVRSGTSRNAYAVGERINHEGRSSCCFDVCEGGSRKLQREVFGFVDEECEDGWSMWACRVRMDHFYGNRSTWWTRVRRRKHGK